jgi:predicted nucleotidyltransferase
VDADVSTNSRDRIELALAMTTLESTDDVIVTELRSAVDGLVAVYRFGSTVQGATTPSSDTDVAVLARHRLPPTVRFDLQERLAALLGRDVDLVDLASASTVMALQVVGYGRLLFEADAAARGQFEDLTFSRYARLNEERRGILERIAAEGSVYGR